MYTPINNALYVAAMAGAFTGMTIAGKQPTDAVQADYNQYSADAAVWAQALDIAYSNATENVFVSAMAQNASEGFWAGRVPLSINGGSVAVYCNAIAAAMKSANAALAAQGISPDAPPSTTLTTVPAGAVNQTIGTVEVPDNATSTINIIAMGKEAGAEAVSIQYTGTFYRDSGGVPQQIGTTVTTVAVAGTADLAGCTFDISALGNTTLLARMSSSGTTDVHMKCIIILFTNK
jgi:hypothetical protein